MKDKYFSNLNQEKSCFSGQDFLSLIRWRARRLSSNAKAGNLIPFYLSISSANFNLSYDTSVKWQNHLTKALQCAAQTDPSTI